MIRTFDGLAEVYDDFRTSSLFYNFEIAIVEPILRQVFLDMPQRTRFLELGAGTGLWTSRLAQIAGDAHKTIGGLASDASEPMLKRTSGRLAAHQSIKVVHTPAVADLLPYLKGGFDLIIAALSVDYIGLAEVGKIVRKALRANGVFVMWLFDHRRYQGSNPRVQKHWSYCETDIRVDACRTTSSDLREEFSDEMDCEVCHFSLPEAGGISRQLVVACVSKDRGPVVTIPVRKHPREGSPVFW